MISFGVLLIQLIYTYLGLFYLLFYLAAAAALFAIMKIDLDLVFSQSNVRILIIGAIFSLGTISFTIFFNKFDIVFYCLILNGFSILTIYLYSLACNYMNYRSISDWLNLTIKDIT